MSPTNDRVLGEIVTTGDRFRAGKRLWTSAEEAVLRARFPHEPTAAVARTLRRTAIAVSARAAGLGLSKTAAYLASPAACRLRRGDEAGARTRFQRGHVPANKGLRRPGWAPGRMKETQFQKGVLNGVAARRVMPIGSTRRVDGYLYRKVSAVPGPWTVNWKPEHVLIFERARGPVPNGHVLVFRNHDRNDIRLENLELITRHELMARNSVHNLPQPLAQAVLLLGALNRKIRKKARDEKQDRRSAESPLRDARSVEGRG